jgi:hypothetical protein
VSVKIIDVSVCREREREEEVSDGEREEEIERRKRRREIEREVR